MNELILDQMIDVNLFKKKKKIISTAAKKTTPEHAFLTLPSEDSWHILNLMLNIIAEISREAFVAKELNSPTICEWFWYFFIHKTENVLFIYIFFFWMNWL